MVKNHEDFEFATTAGPLFLEFKHQSKRFSTNSFEFGGEDDPLFFEIGSMTGDQQVKYSSFLLFTTT